MTDRAEIERLLNQTGRTLEGLPEFYPEEEQEAIFNEVAREHSRLWENVVLHQSDVIELLVGALRDALDKPMQKPLTLEEVWKKSTTLFDNVVWMEYKDENEEYADVVPALVSNYAPWPPGEKHPPTEYRFRYLVWPRDVVEVERIRYGQKYRCWESRPTDEEREAAAWES